MAGLRAVSFDFGNTLVPFSAGPMAAVVRATAEHAAGLIGCPAHDFISVWAEERERQFAEDVPQGREADMDIRLPRVVARLRGRPQPPPGARWDDAAIAGFSTPDEVEEILDAYAAAFVSNTPVPPLVGAMLERLAARWPLALVSNWPLARSVERFLEVASWRRHFSAVVISQTVGVIKPHPLIFAAAAARLGVDSGPAILHVGDDMGADVVGAHAVGWRAAWIRLKPEDSPLPTAAPAPNARPEITIDSVLDLEAVLDELVRP
ncbi:MAG TPA: HAD family hydrolase [Candidatus Limnocylindrales bacterium]